MRSLRLAMAFVVCVLGVQSAAAQTMPAGDGWVVMPIDEYRALRARANPARPPSSHPPPIDATITSIEYDLRASADAALGQAVLAVDVLTDGWAQVAVPNGLKIRRATVGGQPILLSDSSPRQILLARRGRSLVTLDIVVPLTAAAGVDSLTLPASPASMTRARLHLPRDGVELTAAGGFVADRAEGAGESQWTAIGQPNRPLVLAWKRKVDDRRAQLPLRTRARITSLVALAEETSQLTAAVRVEVVQGLASDVALALPRGAVVTRIDGATVADWAVTGDMLRVRLLEPVASDVSFVLMAESRVPRDGTIEVPLIRVPAAERETGGVAVDVAGAGEIAEGRARGLDPIDPSELGGVVAGRESPSMVAFRLRPAPGSESRALSVGVVRYTPQPVLIANVEEARYRALAADDGRLLVHVQLAVRNNQRSFLKVSLPPQSTLWSTSVGGRPIRPGLAEQDAILVPLQKGRAAEEAPSFLVEVVYAQSIAEWSEKTRSRVALPALDLPVSRTRLELHYSPRFRIEPELGTFRVDVDTGPISQVLRALPAPPPAVKAPAPGAAPSGLQALIDRFNAEGRGRVVAGMLPVRVTFPEFGPSIFLASELTPEGQAPFVDILVRAEKGHDR